MLVTGETTDMCFGKCSGALNQMRNLNLDRPHSHQVSLVPRHERVTHPCGQSGRLLQLFQNDFSESHLKAVSSAFEQLTSDAMCQIY